jgi:DNA-directed RNA polymerase subunit H (RpoH/RPB5)
MSLSGTADGVYGLSVEEETLEERKAKILIKLRGYKLVKKEKVKDTVSYIVDAPKEKQKILIWCVPEETVGILTINRMAKAMKEAEIERGILIASGRYTNAAKQAAKKKHIELLPKTFPVFDIFEHKLVPKHEILTPEEREKVLAQYRVKPYQLPQIKASDPAAKAIGAKPGDILRIIRKSPTAGEHIAYRYVVE